jgi:hypothetical protein
MPNLESADRLGVAPRAPLWNGRGAARVDHHVAERGLHRCEG